MLPNCHLRRLGRELAQEVYSRLESGGADISAAIRCLWLVAMAPTFYRNSETEPERPPRRSQAPITVTKYPGVRGQSPRGVSAYVVYSDVDAKLCRSSQAMMSDWR